MWIQNFSIFVHMYMRFYFTLYLAEALIIHSIFDIIIKNVGCRLDGGLSKGQEYLMKRKRFYDFIVKNLISFRSII